MTEDIKLPAILLIEDNADDYHATMRSFKKAHFDNPVVWSKSAMDALDYLNCEGKYQDREPKSPGLILLDLNMPGIDGKEFLALIKQSMHFRRIPIVVLTTSVYEEDVETCYELGASTYIQKPVEFERLVATIQHINDYWFGIAILPKV
jgi:two-component system, response regulator